MPRGLRQLKMIELINTHSVETQAELTQLLMEAGFGATQATISRDIKELGITKIMTPARRYKYVYGHREKAITDKFNNIFKEAVLSVKSAQNIVCVKTVVGSANSACAFLDNLVLSDIIGTIAGDDTIMIVASSTETAEKVREILMGYTV